MEPTRTELPRAEPIVDDDTGNVKTPFARLTNIVKTFSGVHALEDVSVDFFLGEVHSLVGANGAGKSTVGKILAGVHSPDDGDIVVAGQHVSFASPGAALAHGVAIMQQEIALAGKMTVLDNIFLGVEEGPGPLVSRTRQVRRFKELRDRTGFDVDHNAVVDDLRLGEQQQVAVLWALARNARLVVMDEPTASLDSSDAARLLATARSLADAGIGVVYVSHFLEEVLQISDTVTVLANGRHMLTCPAKSLTVPDLVEQMVGSSLDAAFPTLTVLPDSEAGPVLEVRGVSSFPDVTNVSFKVRPGEIVGIFGLVGSGRSELAHLIAGAAHRDQGDILVHGRPADVSNPRKAMDSGITLLPESRKDQGLFLELTVLQNTTSAALPKFSLLTQFVDSKAERAAATAVLDRMKLRGGTRLGEAVGNFSGGNQQKVLLAKCLLTNPDVLILDEPTRGVDIGAKRSMYDLVFEIAAQGKAILFISSEQEEVLHLCHRILVFRGGSIVDEMSHTDASERRLLAAALGAGSESQELP